MRRRAAALAFTIGVLAPVALIGLTSSATVQAAPTPDDPGPPTPATQRLAFASEHHAALVGLDLDTGYGDELFYDSGVYETDRDAGVDGQRLAFIGFRPDAEEAAGDESAEHDGDLWYAAAPFDPDAEPTRLTDDDHVDRHPSLSPDGERIAFASTRDGNTDLYVIGVDGAGLRRLTRDAADDDWPTWSPDGERIAFRSTRDDPDGDLYLVAASGSAGGEGDEPAVRRLTDSPGADGEPAWAPAGGRIAFTTARWAAEGHLAVVDAADRSVTRVGDGTWHGSQPAWSPDGGELAYTSFDADPRGDVFTVDAGGGEPTPASTTPRVAETDPAWSTRADRFLVFTMSVRDPTEGSFTDVYRVAADGAGLTDLTRRPYQIENQPEYAPDGRRLAYTVSVDGSMRVAVAGADGTGQVLVPGPEPDYRTNLTWSPDGRLLAYGHDPGSESDARIVVVRVADGAQLASIPQDPEVDIAWDADPAWSPDGDTIAFSRTVWETNERNPYQEIPVSRIYLAPVSVDGDAVQVGQPARLTDGPQDDRQHGYPDWSPDGGRLVYVRDRSDPDNEDVSSLEVIDADRPDEPRRLVEFPYYGSVASPDWSPDGELIAFSGEREDTDWSAIFRVPADGRPGDESVLFDEVARDDDPTWEPAADLRVHAAIDDDDIPVGSSAAATFTVVNDGPVRASGTTVAVTVPEGLTVEAVEASQGTCDLATRRCALGTLPVGEPAAVEVRVRGDAEGTYPIAAAAASDIVDIEPADNADSVDLRVGRGPDLAVTVRAEPTPGYVGGAPIVVTYRVVNEGEFPAPDAVLAVRVPPELPILASEVTGGSPATGPTGGPTTGPTGGPTTEPTGGPADPPGGTRDARCTPARPCALGTIEPGAAAAVTVRLTLRPAAAVNGLASGTVTTSGLDLDPGDNAGSAPVVVVQPVLELDPPIGPRGFVTDAVGRGFPPGALVRLTWDPGLTAEDQPVRVAADGTFRAQVLILAKDELGERVLRAAPVRGPRFTVEPPLFLVEQGAAQPPDLVIRD